MADNFKITVKYWTKKVGKGKFDRFLNLIKETSPIPKIDWNDKKFSIRKSILKYGQFVHLETDIEDSSEGIMPKQMKALESFTDEELIELFTILNLYVKKEPLSNYIDADGFLSWKNLFSNLLHNFNSKKDKFKDFKRTLFSYLEQELFIKCVISKEIDLSMTIIEDLKILNENKLLPKRFNLGDKVSMDHILDERRILWKKVNNIAPHSRHLLLANPNNFSKHFISKIQDVFETKQLAKLPENVQKYIGTILNLVGVNILAMTKEEILKGLELEYERDSNFNVKNHINIIKKIKKVQNINISQLINYVKLFTENEDLKIELEKKESFNDRDITLFKYRADKINEAQPEKRELLKKIPFKFWKSFFRFNVVNVDEIEELVSLYEDNKNNEMNIPIVSGKVGNYTYEILEKSNPLGLILGYATDCCQVLTKDNGNYAYDGYQCLIEGYKNENATFFVVRKGKDIFAQSFVWQNEKEKVLCFDSIEILGRDLIKNKDVLSSYKEASKKLIELGYRFVIAGADGHSIPNGLKEAGEYLRPVPKKLYPPLEIYSDAFEEIIILDQQDDVSYKNEKEFNTEYNNEDYYDEDFDEEE